MSRTTVVVGGEVVTRFGTRRLDVVIDGGVIVALADDASGVDAVRIDAHGLTVFPGGIDIHTHLREPSAIDREGFFTGTASAVAGGITTVGEMPQAQPLVQDCESFELKRSLAERHSICDVALYAAAVGQEHAELAALQAAGVRAMKAYMCASSPGYPRLDDPGMLACMKSLVELDLPLIVHAENDELLASGLARMASAGRTDTMAHAESRPPLVEVEAIARAVRFADETGARLHVAHVSTPGGAEIVRQAIARGVNVSCETCPQYLLLDHSDLVRLGTWARCAPSIRSRDDVEQLWEYVLDGTICAFGSDHSPYTIEEKKAGENNIFDAPLGLSGIEVMLPALYDEGVNRRGLSLEQFASLSATGPAGVIGLRPRKGAIEVGADADLAIWDLNESWTISASDLLTKHKWTPFDGLEVTGRVHTTIRRGEIVYENGAVLAVPGSGEFLPGNIPAVHESV